MNPKKEAAAASARGASVAASSAASLASLATHIPGAEDDADGGGAAAAAARDDAGVNQWRAIVRAARSHSGAPRDGGAADLSDVDGVGVGNGDDDDYGRGGRSAAGGAGAGGSVRRRAIVYDAREIDGVFDGAVRGERYVCFFPAIESVTNRGAAGET